MRKPLKIGSKEYKFKKDALAHYKLILNSYDFGQSLNEDDYNDLIDLLDYDYDTNIDGNDSIDQIEEKISDDQETENEKELDIEDIKVSKVQFNTKCFEVFFNDKTSFYISYLMIIKSKRYDPEELFYKACRNSIHDDIHSLKQEYFDNNSIKGHVKCQETGIMSKWTELVVDHRQPNTFSIIIDRFKEVHKIVLKDIQYASDEDNHIIFKNIDLKNSFRDYHKDKAKLRIVRKENNSSRTGLARVKTSSKDLIIK